MQNGKGPSHASRLNPTKWAASEYWVALAKKRRDQLEAEENQSQKVDNDKKDTDSKCK